MAAKKAKPKKKQRRYTDQDKAAALTALKLNGGRITETANSFGVPEATLRTWKRQAENDPAVIEKMEAVEISLSDAFEKTIKASLTRLGELLPRSGVGANLDAMKSLTEKFLVLNDRPSEISASNSTSRSVTAEIAFLLQQAAERRERST